MAVMWGSFILLLKIVLNRRCKRYMSKAVVGLFSFCTRIINIVCTQRYFRRSFPKKVELLIIAFQSYLLKDMESLFFSKKFIISQTFSCFTQQIMLITCTISYIHLWSNIVNYEKKARYVSYILYFTFYKFQGGELVNCIWPRRMTSAYIFT